MMHKPMPLLPLFFSFLLAFVLTILPLPLMLQWWQPPWVLFVLMYWSVTFAERFPLWLAWVAGVLLDLYTGSLLGMHALVFVLIVFCLKRYEHRWRNQPSWVRLSGASMIFLGAHLLEYLVMRLTGSSLSLSFWYSWVSACVLWPFVYVVLRLYCDR